jgi:hypothetical protein
MVDHYKKDKFKLVGIGIRKHGFSLSTTLNITVKYFDSVSKENPDASVDELVDLILKELQKWKV